MESDEGEGALGTPDFLEQGMLDMQKFRNTRRDMEDIHVQEVIDEVDMLEKIKGDLYIHQRSNN